MCVRVCCSEVCGTEFSVVLVTKKKVESFSVQLTLTLVLDTRPVLTHRFMCNPGCVRLLLCVPVSKLWSAFFAESRCVE